MFDFDHFADKIMIWRCLANVSFHQDANFRCNEKARQRETEKEIESARKTKHEIIDPIAIKAERMLKQRFAEDDESKNTMRNKEKDTRKTFTRL